MTLLNENTKLNIYKGLSNKNILLQKYILQCSYIIEPGQKGNIALVPCCQQG